MTTRHSEAAAKKCRGSSVLPDPRQKRGWTCRLVLPPGC